MSSLFSGCGHNIQTYVWYHLYMDIYIYIYAHINIYRWQMTVMYAEVTLGFWYVAEACKQSNPIFYLSHALLNSPSPPNAPFLCINTAPTNAMLNTQFFSTCPISSSLSKSPLPKMWRAPSEDAYTFRYLGEILASQKSVGVCYCLQWI